MRFGTKKSAVTLLWIAGLLPLVLQAAGVPVLVVPVQTAAFEDRIEALGTLRANESIDVTAKVTEKVSAVHFDDGDRVAAGQMLIELTSSEERAQFVEAESLAKEAERQYRRVQSLATQGTAAKSLLDERLRELETARARLSAIESRLADRLIKAPFAGVLGLRNISVGALVEPGDLITTLDDDSVMKLDLAVPSVYLSSLVAGLPVVATNRSYAQHEFRGRIHSVDSRVDPVTRSVRVRALLPNDQGLLKPGMLMQVTLLRDSRQALMIPEGGLNPQGRDQFVLVAVPKDAGHAVERRQVRIGSRRPGEVEILEGVSVGDLVITHGSLRVKPGQAVEPRTLDAEGSTLQRLLSGGMPTAAAGPAQ